jgi:hypothetical protein
LNDDSNDGLNLDSTSNRGDWNLARNVINRSKVKWFLGTFELLKSAGTGEIELVLLHQGIKI